MKTLEDKIQLYRNKCSNPKSSLCKKLLKFSPTLPAYASEMKAMVSGCPFNSNDRFNEHIIDPIDIVRTYFQN